MSGDAPDEQNRAAGQFRYFLVASAAFLIIYSLGFWVIQVRRHMPDRRE